MHLEWQRIVSGHFFRWIGKIPQIREERDSIALAKGVEEPTG